MPEVQVDPTPFYAVVGAANIAIDTVRTAGEQLEVARKQAKGVDLRKGAKKEADQLQKDLQKRIVDLQKPHRRAAEARDDVCRALRHAGPRTSRPASSTRASSSRATPRTSTTPPRPAARRS